VLKTQNDKSETFRNEISLEIRSYILNNFIKLINDYRFESLILGKSLPSINYWLRSIIYNHIRSFARDYYKSVSIPDSQYFQKTDIYLNTSKKFDNQGNLIEVKEVKQKIVHKSKILCYELNPLESSFSYLEKYKLGNIWDVKRLTFLTDKERQFLIAVKENRLKEFAKREFLSDVNVSSMSKVYLDKGFTESESIARAKKALNESYRRFKISIKEKLIGYEVLIASDTNHFAMVGKRKKRRAKKVNK
jgi:hypothetical protein